MGHSILGMPFYGNKKLPLSKSIYEGGSGYETMLSAQKIEFSDGLGGIFAHPATSTIGVFIVFVPIRV